jgi:hypothetical protein
MDDLVERLRVHGLRIGASTHPLCEEAADRIEELEAKIERLKYLGYLIDRRTGVERRVVESYKARCGWYNTRQSQRRKENDDE